MEREWSDVDKTGQKVKMKFNYICDCCLSSFCVQAGR